MTMISDDNEDDRGLTKEELEAANSTAESDDEEIGGENDAAEDKVAPAKAKSEPEDDGDEDEKEPAKPVNAPLRAKAPDDAEARMTALDDAETDLQAKFEEGDITAREYSDGLKKIAKERGEIEWAVRKADLAAEMAKDARENAWHGAVADFLTTTAAEIAENKAMLAAFDVRVQEVTADAANVGLSDRAMLTKAWKLFQKDRGIAATPAKAEPAEVDKRGPPAKPKAPPTLRSIPAVDNEDTGLGGKFAAIERLAERDPDAYEDAIRKLSPGERAQFLAA